MRSASFRMPKNGLFAVQGYGAVSKSRVWVNVEPLAGQISETECCSRVHFCPAAVANANENRVNFCDRFRFLDSAFHHW